MKLAGKIFALCLAVWGLLFLYQNCAPGLSQHHGTPVSQAAAANSGGGNGDFYEGKPDPGTYYRTAPDVRCGGGVKVLATVEVDLDSALVSELNLSTCASSQHEVALEDLEQSVYNRTYLGFGAGIYMKQILPLDLLNLNETWCRASNSENAIDVVVQTDLLLLNVRATQWVASRDSQGQVTSDPPATFTVNRTLTLSQLRYSAQNFQLTLDISQPISPTGKRVGQVETVINGETIQRDVECRTGGLLDPLL